MTAHLPPPRHPDRPLDGGEPLVTLSGVAIRSGERVAFQGTSWIIHRGEPWAIVGPNGSGKSLLARALCGQAQIVEGEVHFHFLSPDEAHEARHGWFRSGAVICIGAEEQRRFARQQGGFHQARWHSSETGSSASVGDLLTRQSVEAVNPYQVLPAPTDPEGFLRRQSAAVRIFGLEPLLNRRAVELSNGETRKLLLARAVARQPKLLVLDDPFSGLDAQFRRVLATALDELAASGMALVVVSSRPEELPSCVERVLLVRDHRVVSEIDRAQAERLQPGSATAPPARRRRVARMAAASPLVDLRQVTVRYGEVVALDRVSLRIERGQHWTIVGPNGAGKTTLLSLILADHPQAYANHVEVLGHRRGEGESIWETKSRIGCVSPEMHAHYPAGADLLEVVGSGFHSSVGLHTALDAWQEERARACLEHLLPGCAEHTLGELSNGQQRLALMARALVTHPPLLVLDEPCQGLDARSRARVLEAIDEAVQDGETTLIYVTHHADELPGAITHLLELRQGRTIRQGEIHRFLPGRS
jgi:molybdate transport system ATP-binding protein